MASGYDRLTKASTISASGHAPDFVADIVGDEERAVAGDLDSDRPAKVFVVDPKAGEDVDRHSRRRGSSERNEYHFRTARRAAVPGAVFTYERTLGEGRPEALA